jgi:hypothetical protein
MAIVVDGIYAGRLEPAENYAGCISVFRNAFPAPEQAVSVLEDSCANAECPAQWEQSRILHAGTDVSVRSNSVCPISKVASEMDFAPFQGLHNQCKLSTESGLTSYVQDFFQHDISLDAEGFQALKYEQGQRYVKHSDWDAACPGRTISVLIYLNDNFEGGELDFPFHDVRIAPQAGTMVMFPSSFAYTHEALPVQTGTKYAIVTWFHAI